MPGRLQPYGIAGGVFLLDRLTKLVIRQWVGLNETLTVIPGFCNIVHTENQGAAFSLFAGSQSEWRNFFLIGLSTAAIVLIAALLWAPAGRLDSLGLRVGLALIMGGAAGNLCDRLVQGTVTDFVELYLGDFHWPAFNTADSAITLGAALVLLGMALRRRPAPTT